MTIGDAQSSVHLVEYASLTCPHCAEFHAGTFPQLKSTFIDTGRIAFTLREYPTAPAPVSFAMFQLARCGGAGPDLYFERVAELFRRQPEFLAAGSQTEVLALLVSVGRDWGISEAEVIAAGRDQAGVARVRRAIEAGNAQQITGTPSLALNGQLLSGAFVTTFIGLSAALTRAGA